MSLDLVLALCVFAFVSSVTPGPSNVMLLASGANFGFRRTVPQIFGITIGFATVLAATGLGLGALLAAFPALDLVLKVAGSAYLLYLAWRIASSRAPLGESEASGRPLTFLESAAFQWVNPKSWVVAVTTIAVYSRPEAPLASIAVVLVAFLLVNPPSVSVWAAFGVALRGFLTDPVRLKWFNIATGLLLAATLWPLLS